MTMPADVAAAVGRLAEYNFGEYHASTNPYGMSGVGGMDANWEQALADMAMVANWLETVGDDADAAQTAAAASALAAAGSAVAAAAKADEAAGSATAAAGSATAATIKADEAADSAIAAAGSAATATSKAGEASGSAATATAKADEAADSAAAAAADAAIATAKAGEAADSAAAAAADAATATAKADEAADSAAAAAASAASAENSDAATKVPLAGGKMTGDLVTPRGGAIGSVASGTSIVLGSSGGAQILWETDGVHDWLSFVVHYAGQWHKKVLKLDKNGHLIFTGSAALTTEAGNLTITSAGGVVLVTGTVIHDGAFFDTANARTNTGSAITLTTRAVQRYTLTANATLTLPTVGTGANVRVRIEVSVKQDATGGRTMTVVAPAGQTVVWSGGSPPSLPSDAGKEATFLFERLEGETRWRARRLWTEDPETTAGLGYRYWRLINDAAVYAASGWFDIGEVEMYASADTTGFDLTGGRTVTLSTGGSGGVLVDDDPSGNASCWQVNASAGVGLWFSVDFGTAVEVHSLRLWVASDSTTSRTSPGNARIGSSMRLQYSLDGVNWATSQTITPANAIGWQTFTDL